jgi:hypothetical protein
MGGVAAIVKSNPSGGRSGSAKENFIRIIVWEVYSDHLNHPHHHHLHQHKQKFLK